MADAQPQYFPTTNWNDLASIRKGDADSRQALERICSVYWFPIYAYIRRQTFDEEHSRDLTQGFFEQLLERDTLAKVATHGGRFRSLLLTACRNFLTDAHRHESRQQRRPPGGLLPIEPADLENLYASAVASNDSPERLFERQWALTIMDRSLSQVEQEYRERQRGELFRLLHHYLDTDPEALSHRQTAEKLSLSEAAVKAELHRLRQRLREVLRREVEGTLTDPTEAFDELNLLYRALER